jgi:hypothetical protein
MIQIASKYYITPQTVYNLKKGEPDYFDIIGERGLDVRKAAGIELPSDVVPIKADTQVDIEVESGLGFTAEGKKATMQQISQFMIQLATQGYLTQDAVKQVVSRFLEIFQFGATSEFMDAMESGTQSNRLNEEQLMQMKIAIVEAMKDAGVVGGDKKNDEEDIMKAKIGAMEAIKDAGLAEKEPQTDPIEQAKAELEMRHSDEKHQIDMQGKQQKQKIEVTKAMQDMQIKSQESKSQQIINSRMKGNKNEKGR